MKNIFFLFLIGSTLIACSQKAGESLEHDMSDLEGKWAEMKNKGMIWSKELAAEHADCKAEHKRAAEKLAKDGDIMQPIAKAECAGSLDSVRNDLVYLDSLWKEWYVLDSLWKEDSVEWSFWKQDWAKGKQKIDVARKDLTGWNNKHKDYSARLAEWNRQFAGFRFNFHRHRRTLWTTCGLQGKAL